MPQLAELCESVHYYVDTGKHNCSTACRMWCQPRSEQLMDNLCKDEHDSSRAAFLPSPRRGSMAAAHGAHTQREHDYAALAGAALLADLHVRSAETRKFETVPRPM